MSFLHRFGASSLSSLRAPAVTTLTAAALAACLAGGCKSNSTASTSTTPATQTAAPATKPRPTAGSNDRYEAMAALGYKPQWNAYAVVPKGRSVEFFYAFDDMLIAHEKGNLVTVMETSTGAVRWTLDLADALVKFVGDLRDERNSDIIAFSQTELFSLDSRTGVIKDRQKLAVIANTPPVQFGNMLVYGCPTGEVIGHNLSSGYKQWGYQLTGTIRANTVRMGSNVGIVTQKGDVAILDPKTGSSEGHARIFGGLSNQPASTETTLFIASTDQSIWAFGSNGGAPLWRVRSESQLTSQPVVHDGALYVPVPDIGLVAFAASTGERLWHNSAVTGEVVAARDGKLIVREPGALLAIDPASGQELARVPMQGVSMMVPDAFADGNMYLIEPGGRVQKFSPR